MCKNEIINIRVDAGNKENVKNVVNELEYKNISVIIRDYIEFSHKNIKELSIIKQSLEKRLNKTLTINEVLTIIVDESLEKYLPF